MRQCVSFFLNRGPNSVLRTRKVLCHRKGQESVEKERRRTETRLVALSEQRVRHDKCFDRRYAHAHGSCRGTFCFTSRRANAASTGWVGAVVKAAHERHHDPPLLTRR